MDTNVIRLPGVFPPHPETQLLGSVLERHSRGARRALDLCTGTGVLALALADHGVREVTAVDLGRRAVLSARLNARRRGRRIRVLRGDLFAPVAGRRYDLITSNPPYVPASTDELPRHGAARAWDAGRDGRALLDRICTQAVSHLRPGGSLLLTHSSIADVEESCRQLTASGLEVEVLCTRQDPLGPVMSARAALFESRGLLEAGCQVEELAVIRARAPALPRFTRSATLRPALQVG